jgi:hypothetical protein
LIFLLGIGALIYFVILNQLKHKKSPGEEPSRTFREEIIIPEDVENNKDKDIVP